ncbi:MAG: ABC transporter permease [Gammaproteobacteria bacterium]|nr:ABC transporter permease [Pseudomonadales bacterium]MCP5347934.1 ABC transporter permease [Pseudomonadales bacterium]
MKPLPLTLAGTLTRIFLRDRQAIFFSLFFPIIFMVVFGFVGSQEQEPIALGIVNHAPGGVSDDLIDLLDANPLFQVTVGEEPALRESLISGDTTLVLIVPAEFQETDRGVEMQLLVDAAQVQELNLIMPVLEQSLLSVERQLRNSEPLFRLNVEDVRARSQRYLDFLIPGLLAFTLMQVSIAGSGFNIVEYRRKGILKRLFVTPLQPRDFITAIVMSRITLCILQIAVLLGIAVLFLDVRILGSYLALFTVIFCGAIIFLCIGFLLGSLAKTQQSIQAIGNLVIFPQIFLSGIFYPIDSLPGFLQPVASLLPLSFVANALREIANNGASLLDIPLNFLGIAVWMIISFVAATRYFVWKEVAA